MPLKRVTPSFTVEYRQAKRPNPGSAKPGWADVRPAPDRTRRERRIGLAISAFKTVAAHPPADVISPSISPGRILPSLVEAAPVTGQPTPGGAQSRSHGSTAQAGHAMQVPADGAVALGTWRAHLFCRRPRGRLLVASGLPIKAAGDLGPERYKGGNAKIGETDPASCRKAREVRSRF